MNRKTKGRATLKYRVCLMDTARVLLAAMRGGRCLSLMVSRQRPLFLNRSPVL